MGIIHRLATSLGRRDEAPNQELAADIVSRKDNGAVKELVALLHHTDKNIQQDAIKVLYETGVLQPGMISPYLEEFMSLLDSRNNRLQWGAMTALKTIAPEAPDAIYPVLGKLAAIADKGSVITRDNYMSILVSLYQAPAYATEVFALYNEQLLLSPENQLPMYAELMAAYIRPDHTGTFRKALSARLTDMEQASKIKRIEKVLKKLS